jgi:hypothetical protein
LSALRMDVRHDVDVPDDSVRGGRMNRGKRRRVLPRQRRRQRRRAHGRHAQQREVDRRHGERGQSGAARRERGLTESDRDGSDIEKNEDAKSEKRPPVADATRAQRREPVRLGRSN